MGNELEKEIASMNTLNGGEPVGTDAPGTDSPSTDAPTTDIPRDFSTDAPSTEVSSTDAPTTDAPDEIALLKAEIELLKAQNSKTTDAPPTDAPTTDVPIQDVDFIGDENIDEIINDRGKFNKLLNSIYKKGVESTKGINLQSAEDIIKSIPDIVKNNITVMASLKKASDDFYDNNKDLIPFKKVVATVFEEYAAANPDKSYIENLKDVGDEVRKRLELKKGVKQKEVKGPKLPKSKGNKRVILKPDTKGIESEIDAMNKSIKG